LNESLPSHHQLLDELESYDEKTRLDSLSKILPCLDKADEYQTLTLGEALAKIGKPALPDIFERLKAGNTIEKRICAYAIGQMGPRLVVTVEPLIFLLESQDRDVRLNSVIALGKLGPMSNRAVPKLIDIALREPDGIIKSAASRAITRIGIAATPALVDAIKKSQLEPETAELFRIFGSFGAISIPTIIEACMEGKIKFP
jgi:HEAT repeat protein